MHDGVGAQWQGVQRGPKGQQRIAHRVSNRRYRADYAAFARAKARLSWLTGRDGRTVQALLPHLLRDGDTALSGGVCLDGIVVGVSGAFPEFDELFAGAVALALRALARQAREADDATTLRASAERTG